MVQKTSPIISAEAILKSKSGRSLAHEDVAITAKNVAEFTPAPETIAKATSQFEQLGFTVSHAALTLTLTGKPELFEKVFKVKLNLEKEQQTGGVIVHPMGELSLPDPLRDVVEEVVFPEPPELFP